MKNEKFKYSELFFGSFWINGIRSKFKPMKNEHFDVVCDFELKNETPCGSKISADTDGIEKNEKNYWINRLFFTW